MGSGLRGAAARGRTPPGTPTIKERWDAARTAGERTFDPGVECVNGHVSDRWTNNGICVLCKRQRDNEYNAKNKEQHRARSRASQLRRRAEVTEYHRAWRTENRGKWLATISRRKARKLGADAGDSEGCKRFFSYASTVAKVACYWCGKNVPKAQRHVDHIIPLARGGAETEANLCVSCANCNLRKHAKDPIEFAGQGELSF